MKGPLKKLNSAILKLKSRAFFNLPASKKEIANFEKNINFSLTNDLREFYSSYNGGFFADSLWNITDIQDKEKYNLIKWNSNHFLKLTEIIEHFENIETLLEIEMGENRNIKYFPFLQTKDQELFVIRFSLNDNNNSVHKLVRQTPSHYWNLINDNFEHFLNNYVEKFGNILPY
ncbi:MAG: SMI1/KNR4 family protein [Bacteroidota bacterium]|nr:SMI1/KNR4 family protein [Bacteroidota bacterium]